jgi:GalNAc-alpha-(1->4)-GalNAc-alpha-(1->3)-diNAcBac-PP-undecaprenol alpha-1,4-N-acetyl-D-galactosaminyltransferase
VRIAFVIPGLGPGGAERVASLLCNFWAGQNHSVTLITFEAAAPFHKLYETVTLRQLDVDAGQRGVIAKLVTNFRRISRLRGLLRELRPDTVVAFTTDANVVTLCAASGLGVPVVISERNQPERPGLGRVHKLARAICYRFARAIVVQTEPIADWVRARFRIQVYIIPNPVLLGPARIESAAPDKHAGGQARLLISVGRLTHQKGFDLLIESFARLAVKHPDWRLVIHGEGPARASLEQLRDTGPCGARIALPGLTRDIQAALDAASLFALPSRFEGYPNALLEALGAGLPVVATACPGGTVEILAEGAYGMLVPPDDIGALTAALDTMMSAPALRETYARSARDAVAELDVAIIGRRWLDLLASLRR